MPIYQNSKTKLSTIKEKPFKLEKEIQTLFEENLENIMGLQLIKSEFTIKNKRIDTLGYDKESKAFIIIEYKRGKNISVVDQGLSYLSLMLENKADFIIEYNETQKETLKRTDVDWSQSRVVFVSQSFTENQRLATNFKDLGIELWEVKQYENNTVAINSIKKSASAESIKPLTKQNQEFKAVQDEIKVYSEEDHLSGKPQETIELYERFKEAVLNLDNDIELRIKKLEIGFEKKGKLFFDIHLQKKGLKMWINLKKGELDDPKSLFRDMSEVGHIGNGDYELQVSNDKDIEYIMSLVKQAL